MLPVDRVRGLVTAAKRLADPRDPLGQEARSLLPESSGLCRQNVELALTEILETQPTEAELRELTASVEPAPRAHVLLSANVFTAALRSVALALAQSADVCVRPSRREPVFARLLCDASGAAFRLVESLEPAPGDHVWAFGADTTLGELERALPAGVVLHAHGSGLGVALVAGDAPGAAAALVRDVVPFDQRGCLSPRAAIVVGTRAEARAFAEELARALALAAERTPLGRLDDDERADGVRMRETLSYAGEVFPAGPGWVALDASEGRLLEAPVGRNLVVVPSGAALDWLEPQAGAITAVGVAGPEWLRDAAAAALPEARLSALGSMQRPRFDGPVDRRSSARARVLTGS